MVTKFSVNYVKESWHITGSTTTLHNHLRAKHPSPGGPSTGQQSVDSFLVRPRMLDARRAEKMTLLLSKMIAKETLYPSGEGFREFMAFVEPEYSSVMQAAFSKRKINKAICFWRM